MSSTRSLAVVIGINKYSQFPLKTAVNDASAIASTLKDQYKYEIKELLDSQATLENINNLLTALQQQTFITDSGNKIQINADDRLLFYFAGHGIASDTFDDDETPEGFLLPQDAKFDATDNTLTFLAMRELHDVLVNLPCRHLLIILDCCFAGSFRWVGLNSRQVVVKRKAQNMYLERYERFIAGCAQQVITSAAYDQKAADIAYRIGKRGENNNHSPFAKLLLEGLQIDPNTQTAHADWTGDGVISATELYQYVFEKLPDYQTKQIPAIIQLKKHSNKGEYIFPVPGFDPEKLPKAVELTQNNNPYKGLQSFEEEDSEFFFGRTNLIEKLASVVEKQPLTVVLGASGTGKSSIAKAGLIPYLKLQQPSSWVILPPMRPDSSPFKALHNLVVTLVFDNKNFTGFLKPNKPSEQELDKLYTRFATWCQRNPNSKLLLVIDQFEELITLSPAQERKRFLDFLAKAIDKYENQLRVVLTLRSDFEPHFLDGTLKKYWDRGEFIVPQMVREELRQAIEEPATKRVIYFESSKLIDQLIDEVLQTPSPLPLLSFALSQLYLIYVNSARSDRTIKEADLEKLGGVTRCITNKATEVYNKLLQDRNKNEQTICNVLLRMVAVEGNELSRRQVRQDELTYSKLLQKEVDEIIEEFVKERLLIKGTNSEGDECIEPAHNALVLGWSQLQKWVNQEKQNLIQLRRLTIAALDWQKKGKQRQYLWHAHPYLDVLSERIKTNKNWFNKLEIEFIEKSIRFKEKRNTLRQTFITGIFAGLVGFIFIQWCQNQDISTGRLAATSESLFESNKQLDALTEAIKAGQKLKLPIGIEDNTKLQTMTALHQAIYWISSRDRLLGHTETVRDISFSPDGQIIASASVDKTIRLWNVSGEQLNTLKGHRDIVNSISFSPNGQLFASGSYDKTIKLWSINGKLLENQIAHDKEVYSVNFSPDGKMLVSSSWDGTIKLWKVNKNKLIFYKFLETPKEIASAIKQDRSKNRSDLKPYSFFQVRFSPDGKFISAGNEDGKVRIWDREGKLLQTLSGHNERVFSVRFSPNGKMLASSSRDNTILVWNLKDPKIVPSNTVNKDEVFDSTPKILAGHKDEVFSIAFSDDSKTLISGSNDNTIKFWHVEDGREIKTLAGHSNPVRSVALSPNGKILASGGIDTSILLWSATNEDAIALIGHRRSIYDLSFSPDGKTLATASDDTTSDKKFYKIKLWRRVDGKELIELNGHTSRITKVAFHPNNQILASADSIGNIILWNYHNGQILNTINPGHSSRVTSLTFSHDGQILASGAADGIKLWDIKGQQVTQFADSKDISSLSFTPDGKILASGSTNRKITLWDVKQGKKLQPVLKGHKGTINSLSFNRDGKILASASEDEKIKLWRVFDGEELGTLEGHVEGVSSVTFSPVDKNILASGSNDKTIRLWNVEKRKGITTLKGHSSTVYNITFSPDGKTLASASADNTALLWNAKLLNLDTALARGCKWVSNYQSKGNSFYDRVQDICDSISDTDTTLKISSGKTILTPTRLHPDKVAGVEAYISNNFQTAVKHFQNYLNSNSNDPEALIYKNNAEISNQKSYAIAVSVPLTNQLSNGLEILRGVAQAQDEINKSGGINGTKLRVIIADDENDPKIAKQIAIALADNQDILGVVGHFTSDVAIAAGKVYSEKQLPAILPVSTSVYLPNQVPGFGNYVFRTVPNDRQAAIALAEYLRKYQGQAKKIAVFYNSKSEYSRSLKSEFIGKVDWQVLNTFDFSDSQFKAKDSVERSLQAGIDVLVLLPDTTKLNRAIAVLKQNDNRLPILGGDSLYSSVTLEMAGKYAQNMTTAVSWDWTNANKYNPKYTSESQRLWKGYVNWRTAMSYDATQALIAALKSKPENPNRLDIALALKSNNFIADGATGAVQFSPNGERKAAKIELVKIQPGSRSGYGYDFVTHWMFKSE